MKRDKKIPWRRVDPQNLDLKGNEGCGCRRNRWHQSGHQSLALAGMIAGRGALSLHALLMR
jgi:hypothetical protein